MGRPAGSINQIDKAARKILSDAQALKGFKLQRGQLDTLDIMAHGGYRPRNASAVLGALRLKMEYAYSKPKQETELSGNVTITVASPLPGPPGSARQAKALPVATIDAQVLSLQQRPITANMSTSERGGMAMDSPIEVDYVTNEPEPLSEPDEPQPERFDPMTAPTIIEDGKLRAWDDGGLTADQRRERARDEWKAEQARMRGV